MTDDSELLGRRAYDQRLSLLITQFNDHQSDGRERWRMLSDQFSAMNTTLASIDGNLARINGRLGRAEVRQNEMDDRLAAIEKDGAAAKGRTDERALWVGRAKACASFVPKLWPGFLLVGSGLFAYLAGWVNL